MVDELLIYNITQWYINKMSNVRTNIALITQNYLCSLMVDTNNKHRHSVQICEHRHNHYAQPQTQGTQFKHVQNTDMRVGAADRN